MSNGSNSVTLGTPVLPCQNLDVEVVSDVIEDYADIEVVAKPKDEPEPDLEIVAVFAEDIRDTAKDSAEEPDYDVEVSAILKEEPQPDLEVRAITDASPVTGGDTNGKESAAPNEPDYDVEVQATVKEESQPDIEVRALTDVSPVSAGAAGCKESASNSDTTRAADGPPPEPDYDVEVTCNVKDAEEPDLELTCSITGDSNDAAGGSPNGR